MDYSQYITVTEDEIICRSPEPTRGTCSYIAFNRHTVAPHRSGYIGVAKKLVKDKLIPALFGAVQVYALETHVAE